MAHIYKVYNIFTVNSKICDNSPICRKNSDERLPFLYCFFFYNFFEDQETLFMDTAAWA